MVLIRSTIGVISSPWRSETVESCLGSQPTWSTRRPIAASVALMFDELVDLPMPPLPKKTSFSTAPPHPRPTAPPVGLDRSRSLGRSRRSLDHLGEARVEEVNHGDRDRD